MNADFPAAVASSRIFRSNEIAFAKEALVLLAPNQLAVDVPPGEPSVETDVVHSAPAHDELEEMRGKLEAALSRVQQAAVETKKNEKDAYQRGVAVGRDEGKAAHENEVDARIRVFEEAVTKALAMYDASLARLETAASGIALAAVEQVIGDDAATAKYLLLAVTRQLSQLRDAGVIEIRVSSTDFPDLTELHQVVQRSGKRATLTDDSALGSGQCRIRLGLGEMTLDLQQQLAAVRQIMLGSE